MLGGSRLAASALLLMAAVLAGCGATQDMLAAFGGVVGTVVDSQSGSPVSGAQISVGGIDVTTDSGGRFRITNLPAGEQSYTVTATGYRTDTGAAVRVQPNITVDLDVALVAQQVGAGTVYGTVTRLSDGAPLGGVTVTVGSLTTTSDALGEYRLTAVPAGEQTVSFEKPTFGTSTATVTVTEDGDHKLDVSLDQFTVGSVVGTVVDSRTGTGIDGVVVVLGSLGLSTASATDGQYALANVPAGTYDVSYDRTGYRSETFAVTVVANGATTQDVSLVAPAVGQLSGTVHDQLSTLVVAGVSVTVAGLGRQTTTDETGAYSFADIPAGAYELTFSRTGYSDAVSSVVTVLAGTTTIFDALISPLMCRIEGFVLQLEAGGGTAVVAGATLRLGTDRTATSNSDGSYAFDNVPPLGQGGLYTINASATGYRPVSVTVVPVAGEVVAAPDLVLNPVASSP